jgi:hypothetical protein
LRILHHRRDIAQGGRCGIACRRTVEGNLGQFLGRRDGQLVEDIQPLVDGVDESPGAGCRCLQEGEGRNFERVAGGVDNLGESSAAFLQPFRVDEDLQLPVPEAPDGDVGDAWYSHQPRADHPPGQHGHVDRSQRFR